MKKGFLMQKSIILLASFISMKIFPAINLDKIYLIFDRNENLPDIEKVFNEK